MKETLRTSCGKAPEKTQGHIQKNKSSTIKMTLEWIEFHEIFERNLNSDFLEHGSTPWNENQMMSLSRLYRKSFSSLDLPYEDNRKSAVLTTRWHLLKKISNRNNRNRLTFLNIVPWE